MSVHLFLAVIQARYIQMHHNCASLHTDKPKIFVFCIFLFFCSVSSDPDQPTEQRWLPVHLPRESLCRLPVRSHRPPPGCDELHWLRLTCLTHSAPLPEGAHLHTQAFSFIDVLLHRICCYFCVFWNSQLETDWSKLSTWIRLCLFHEFMTLLIVISLYILMSLDGQNGPFYEV